MGLESCKMCKALREALDRSDIDHVFSDCNKDPDNCDALEALTGTVYYPMILISDLEDNLMEVAFLANDYSQLDVGTSTRNGIKLIANHSLDGLLKYTINRLNLNI